MLSISCKKTFKIENIFSKLKIMRIFHTWNFTNFLFSKYLTFKLLKYKLFLLKVLFLGNGFNSQVSYVNKSDWITWLCLFTYCIWRRKLILNNKGYFLKTTKVTKWIDNFCYQKIKNNFIPIMPLFCSSGNVYNNLLVL